MKKLIAMLTKFRLRKTDKSLTARTKAVLGLSLVIFFVAFLISLFVFSYRSRWEYGKSESETVLNAMSDSIQANIQSYKDISRLVMLNASVRTFLNAEEVDSGLNLDTRFGVLDVLIASDNVDSVFVFRNDKQYMCTGRGEYILDDKLLDNYFWKQEIYIGRGGAIVFMNANGAVYRENGNPLITIARAIYDIDTQERVGILLVNISTGMLEYELLEQENSEICVVTTSGEYLAGSEELGSCFSKDYVSSDIIHKRMKYGKTREMISGMKLEELPLVVMCATGTKSSSIPIEVIIVMALVLIAFLISISLAAVFITKDITKPIFELSEGMEKTKETGYLEKIDVSMPENELGMLAESYNGMIEHLNKLFTEVVEKEKSVQKAEMRVLQEQIKPHFLYNSLESISFMAINAGAPDVHNALETLGSFYRNFLSKGDREIPLKREISIVKDYLALQKLRYGDIINDEYDIAEDTLECKIPKLILQPLIENSINHGIRLTGEPGTIKVTAFVEGDVLHIKVRDTGVGMPQDVIEAVLNDETVAGGNDAETFKEDPASQLSGFGLKGTIERIRYYCNSKDVVSIKSEVGEFTEIELIIPISGGRRD